MRHAWVIARHDLRELSRDGRLLTAAIVTGLLLVAATATGLQRTSRAATERAAAQQAERDRWLNQGEVNPHAAAHYGTFVFAPANPLALVDPGVTTQVPAAVFVEAHRQQLARHRPLADALTFRRLGELSVAGCLRLVVPLFVTLLAAGAIARERERGTWSLLQVHGASPLSITAGKALAVAVGLAIVTGPALAVATGLVLVSTDLTFDLEDWRRSGWLVLAYAIYLATWLLIGLAVSRRHAAPARALATAVAIWLVTCVVAPPALMTLATTLVPAPTVAEFVGGLDDERATRPTWDDRVAAATERFLNGEDLPAASNPEVVALIETEAADTELYGRHLAQLADRLDHQEATFRRLSWLTPAAAMSALSMGLAGSDFAHYRDFTRAASDYRSVMLRTLNDDLAAFDSWKTFNAAGNRELWARVPEFDYELPPASWAVRRLGTPATGLILWFVAGLVAATRGSRPT